MAKKQKIEFEFDFDESALSRAERRILEFLRKLSGASAKADEATRRRTAEWMAGPEGAAYRRQAPPGFEYDPIGASASQTYRSDKARQRFRAQQDYLRTGNRPGTSFTDQAMERLRNFMHDMPGGDTAIKTGKSAWGVAKGTLGVAAGAAGIGGIVSVISHAFSEYRSKIGDQEALFKRTGGSWTSLGQSIEELGKRVNINAAEAGRLASSFQRLSGATDTGLIGRAGAAGSLARSLGMGPEAGVTALGRAEFMGFGGSEGRQRQFANLIGQTIADGNMLGSSEKVFEDILKHIQGVEENTGNLPSDIALAGFASLRAAMYDQNAAMKGAAGDSAVAKAQAFVSGKGGLWNEAFLARAFDKELRGAYDSAVAFDYLKGANMFDTVDSVFGNGSKETILSRDLKRLDLETRELMPGASELDILRRKSSIMGMGSPQLAQKFLEAAEAAEKSSGFGAWAKGKFDFLQNPSALGGAVSLYQSQNDPEKLKALARQYTEGEHVKTSQADKDRINAAMGDPGKLAMVLQEVIAKQGEAGNAAEDLRDEVAKLNNTLTSIIGPRMADLATNLAKFSNKFVELFNRVFGGGDSNAPPPTNEFENWTRRFESENSGPDGLFDWMDDINRFIGFPDRDEIFRDFTTPIGGTNEELLGRIRDRLFGPGGMVRITRGGTPFFPEAQASMNAGDYPGEGLQELAFRTGGGFGGEGNSVKSGNMARDPNFRAHIAKLEKERGIPSGTLAKIMLQESSGDNRGYHYKDGASNPMHSDFGLFGIKKDYTGKDPGYGIKPLQGTSPEEQARFAADLLSTAIKETGGVESGVAAFHTGIGGWNRGDPKTRADGNKYVGYVNGQSLPKPSASRGSDGIIDVSGKAGAFGYRGYGKLAGRKGFIMHHTGGRGTVDGVMRTFGERDFPAHYVIDRDGKTFRTLPEGQQGRHIRSNRRFGLSNANTEGVEIIANDDKDVLPAQIEAANQLRKLLGYSAGQVYGHGEINAHKQHTEGHAAAEAVRMAGDSPGMARLPDTNPVGSSLPLTSGYGAQQPIPIQAVLDVRYSDGSRRTVAQQPIAGNPATPGMRAQQPYGAPG